MPKRKRVNRSLRSRKRIDDILTLPTIRINDAVRVNVVTGPRGYRTPFEGKIARVIAISPDPHTNGTLLRLFFKSRMVATVPMSAVTRMEVAGRDVEPWHGETSTWMQTPASAFPCPDAHASTRTQSVIERFNADR